MVYILLAEGFEEMEALVLCDVLRRGGVETALCAVTATEVRGGHGILVRADCSLGELDLSKAEMVAVPGGLGGVENILKSQAALAALRQAHAQGIWTAAICAGPMVLAELGITDGAEIAAYPGLEARMGSAKVTDKNVVAGPGFLTGRGPGAAFDFALAALEILRGREAADAVAEGMCYDRG